MSYNVYINSPWYWTYTYILITCHTLVIIIINHIVNQQNKCTINNNFIHFIL